MLIFRLKIHLPCISFVLSLLSVLCLLGVCTRVRLFLVLMNPNPLKDNQMSLHVHIIACYTLSILALDWRTMPLLIMPLSMSICVFKMEDINLLFVPLLRHLFVSSGVYFLCYFVFCFYSYKNYLHFVVGYTYSAIQSICYSRYL